MHVQYCSRFIILPLYFNVNCITALVLGILMSVSFLFHVFHPKKCNQPQNTFLLKLNDFFFSLFLLNIALPKISSLIIGGGLFKYQRKISFSGKTFKITKVIWIISISASVLRFNNKLYLQPCQKMRLSFQVETR